jgi:copper chaperone NosL
MVVILPLHQNALPNASETTPVNCFYLQYFSIMATIQPRDENPWLRPAGRTAPGRMHLPVNHSKERGISMKNRKSIVWLGLMILFVAAAVVGSANPVLADEHACHYCGMKKMMFGHSWVTVEREDGSVVGVCSVHCAAIDMALNIDKPAKNITVGDFNSKKQIDADSAYWVIGGDKMGVMTMRAKWAFESKESADGFMKQHGGRPATFEEVMKAAFEDMYQDTLMIQKKRKMMRMKKAKSNS